MLYVYYNNFILPTKPKYVGWAVLGENETRKRGLFDEQDATQATGDNSKRSLRSTRKLKLLLRHINI